MEPLLKRSVPFLCVLGIALLIPALLFGQAAGEGKPELWTRAVRMMEQQKKQMPGKIHTVMESLDRKGRVSEVEEYWEEIVADGVHGYRQELIRALENGSDVTEKERERRKKRGARKKSDNDEEQNFSFDLGDSPMNPKKQQSVEVRATGERQELFGHHCLRFDFVMKASSEEVRRGKKGVMKGFAWLDEQAACPVKIEFTRDPLPRFAKRFWSVLHYDADPSGAWVIREMRFEGEGGFLFIRKAMRIVVLLGEYQEVN